MDVLQFLQIAAPIANELAPPVGIALSLFFAWKEGRGHLKGRRRQAQLDFELRARELATKRIGRAFASSAMTLITYKGEKGRMKAAWEDLVSELQENLHSDLIALSSNHDAPINPDSPQIRREMKNRLRREAREKAVELLDDVAIKAIDEALT
jgi:hypothetical protein